MSSRAHSRTLVALTLGLSLAFTVHAQTNPEPVEVSATTEVEVAPTTVLTDAHGPAAAGDAAAGEAKADICAACHGVDGNSPIPMYPKLAGQHENYIARQLALYKDGSRVDPVMAGFAAMLEPQDMRDLGAYFAGQSIVPGSADDSLTADDEPFYALGQRLYRGGDLERGIPACLACHGPGGHGNPAALYPAVGGQHADYTVTHLEGFRAGTAWGQGENANTIMVDVARHLTDEEIRSLATYIEGLHDVSEVATR